METPHRKLGMQIWTAHKRSGWRCQLWPCICRNSVHPECRWDCPMASSQRKICTGDTGATQETASFKTMRFTETKATRAVLEWEKWTAWVIKQEMFSTNSGSRCWQYHHLNFFMENQLHFLSSKVCSSWLVYFCHCDTTEKLPSKCYTSSVISPFPVIILL